MEALLAGMPDIHAGPKTGESTSAPAPVDKLPAIEREKPAPAKLAEPAIDETGDAVDVPELDAKPDPAAARGLAAVAKAEARSRAQADQRKTELDRREQQLLARENEATSKVVSSEKFLAELRRDPAAALLKHGLTIDDLEPIAQAAYLASPAGQKELATKPGAKAAADKALREREQMTELQKLQKHIGELEAKFEGQTKAQTAQKFVEQYLDTAVKAIPTTPSLIGNLHAKAPAKARAALLSLGQQMEREAMEADGVTTADASHTPTHAEVIAEYEKRRREELEEQGVDVDAMLKRAAPAPVAPAAKKPAATLDPTAAGSTARPVDRSRMSEEQRRQEMLKNMPWKDD